MVERAVGLGRVVLLASPPTPGWSTLPFKPAFLPFLHSLVSYLGQGPGSRRNLRVGDPLVWAAPDGKRQPSARSEAWLLEEPDASRVTLQPVHAGKGQSERPIIRLDAVPRAGFYFLRRASGNRSPEGAANGEKNAAVTYAANLRTDESDLRSLSRRELEARMRPAPLRWVDPHESMAAVVREGRQGREAWRGLLFAALALMLCESGMAQIFGRRRGE